MTPFDLSLRTRIVFREGSAGDTGTLARELGARCAYLVTDPGVVRAGHAERVERSLADAGLEVRRFDRVPENPSSDDVEACRSELGDWPADLLVGLGGGSAIDCAKGCAFVHAGGGRMDDYRGRGKARGALLPLVAIPTTAGTGTETQSFALIEQPGTHQKMACGDPGAAPRIAVLDPTLTITMPRLVTACTGLDAIGHAVETAVTKAATPVSTLFSTEAFTLAHRALAAVLDDPEDIDARGAMLLAAAWAGVAIESSMLGAAHAMANPLTAHHGLAHGLAVGLVLPHVVRFNAAGRAAATGYARLSRASGLVPSMASDAVAVAALVARLNELLDAAGAPRSLAAAGVPTGAATTLAEEAARQWTAAFNPREVTADEFRSLYEAAAEGTA